MRGRKHSLTPTLTQQPTNMAGVYLGSGMEWGAIVINTSWKSARAFRPFAREYVVSVHSGMQGWSIFSAMPLTRGLVHVHVFPPSFLVHWTNLLLTSCLGWAAAEYQISAVYYEGGRDNMHMDYTPAFDQKPQLACLMNIWRSSRHFLYKWASL